MAQLTTVKDVPAYLRHANAPASVRIVVESLDLMLKSNAEASEGESN
jgi:hypothetical protein